MKILVIQDRLRSGGTERQSVLLANAFAAAGHTTKLLTFRPGGPLADTVAPLVTRHVLQPFDLGLDWFAPGIFRHVRRAQPDVVLCMGRMANCYAGGLQQHLPAGTVIATMRTGKTLPRLFLRSLHLVRHVVANSSEARDNLIAQHAIPPERISVIHNSLVFPPAPPTGVREQLRAQHGATDRTVVLLCVAMFRPEKNQRELIEILSELSRHSPQSHTSAGRADDPSSTADDAEHRPDLGPNPTAATAFDWQLWLGGDGPSRVACEALVAQKNLCARVKFLGWQRDPSPLYAAADIAVHASWSEALSNFLIEAQAAGVPAVAYNAQGIAECFVPGETGFVISRDNRAAFRAKIAELANADDATKAARTARARAYARATFNHDGQVARYLELFAQLQKRAGRADYS